VFVQIVLIWYN
jgi:hypothetical protein